MFAGHLGAQPMHLIQPHQRSLNICDVPGTTLARETKQLHCLTAGRQVAGLRQGSALPAAPPNCLSFPVWTVVMMVRWRAHLPLLPLPLLLRRAGNKNKDPVLCAFPR